MLQACLVHVVHWLKLRWHSSRRQPGCPAAPGATLLHASLSAHSQVDEKMDKVTKELQTNNMRLKGLVTKVGRGCAAGGSRVGTGIAGRQAGCRAALVQTPCSTYRLCSPALPPFPSCQMRSTRNFVVDIVLICILLAIGLYLYK